MIYARLRVALRETTDELARQGLEQKTERWVRHLAWLAGRRYGLPTEACLDPMRRAAAISKFTEPRGVPSLMHHMPITEEIPEVTDLRETEATGMEDTGSVE
jgi:hypothetical protein